MRVLVSGGVVVVGDGAVGPGEETVVRGVVVVRRVVVVLRVVTVRRGGDVLVGER